MLFFLLLTSAFARMQQLTTGFALQGGVLKESLTSLFSDKFNCFQDTGEVYKDYFTEVYGGVGSGFVCCGLMANGRRQCDRMEEWKQIGDSRFSLCDNNYVSALNTDNHRMRRDMCCENNDFNDCGLCAGFMVWDWSAIDSNGVIGGNGQYYGGDNILEKELKETEATPWTDTSTGVTLSTNWRETYDKQLLKEFTANGKTTSYPPYAYDNDVYPAGFHVGTLREYNDPPVCVYAPNVAGRVIEVKVEPEEAGSQVCVDDLHEDSLQRNDPGVTQACDDSKLQTCFADATPDDSVNGFAFLISCKESCADGPVDLNFRLRASIMKWTDAGDESKGTTNTEVNTEMWCMWGNQDMRDAEGDSNFPAAFPDDLTGDFSKWDVFPSDLAPEEDPVVFPAPNGVSMLTITSIFALMALLF